jgi:hypothetical protein
LTILLYENEKFDGRILTSRLTTYILNLPEGKNKYWQLKFSTVIDKKFADKNICGKYIRGTKMTLLAS